MLAFLVARADEVRVAQRWGAQRLVQANKAALSMKGQLPSGRRRRRQLHMGELAPSPSMAWSKPSRIEAT